MKKIAVLGSTGSIGQSTLSVAEKFPDRFKVVSLAAGNNVDLLEKQVRQFKPEIVSVMNPAAAERLKKRFPDLKLRVHSGVEGLIQVAAAESADIVVSAIVGTAGLVPTMAAVRARKMIALANKEVLVTAGELVVAECRARAVQLLPVDSEHSAIFQCLQAGEDRDIRNLILTASGGPFRNHSKKDMAGVTLAQALKHPNWSMGRKITIDSATLMNKGLEVIEARWLFDIPVDRIAVNIHPQSIIHSMVEYVDGSVMAQLGMPDMKGPIAYALTYPARVTTGVKPLDLTSLSGLTFFNPDTERFPALKLAYRAARSGESMPAVMNAANEIAVEAFLEGRIGFMAIAESIEKVMDLHEPHALRSIEEVLEADRWGRRSAREVLGVRQ